MKAPFKQRHPLFRPLAGMTFSILLLFFLSYFFMLTSSDKLSLNASMIRSAATQRSLSQQIVNSIAADNLEGQIWITPLDSLINSFSHHQNALLHEVDNLKRTLSPEYHKLDKAYTEFSQQLDRNISNNSSENFVNLLGSENNYIQQLDNLINTTARYSNDEIRKFKIKETCILLISVALIFFQVRLIFIPAIKKIEGQNGALREISFTQSHIVRRPLANVQSLLTLTLDVKNQDPYSVQLLTLAKKEIDELDEAIKGNIHKSDKNYKHA